MSGPLKQAADFYPPQHTPNRSIWAFVHKGDAPQLMQCMRDLLLLPRPHGSPLRHVRCRLLVPGGQYLAVHAALRPGPQGMVCSLRPEEAAAVAGLVGGGQHEGSVSGSGAGGKTDGSQRSGWWDTTATFSSASG